MTIAAVAGVEPHEAGLASGLINTSQQVGGALGLAILAAVANSRTDSVVEAGSSLPVALTEGFQTALMVGAGFAILGARARLPAGRRPRGRGERRRRAGAGHDVAKKARHTATCSERASTHRLNSPGSRWMPEAASAASARSPPSRVSFRHAASHPSGPTQVSSQSFHSGPSGPLRTLLRCASPCSGWIGRAQRAERGVQVLDAGAGAWSRSRGRAPPRRRASSAAPRPRSRREHRERAAEAAQRLVAVAPARGRRRPGRPSPSVSTWRQKEITCPSCSCGPGGSSSLGATTGAPGARQVPGDRDLAPLPGRRRGARARSSPPRARRPAPGAGG